MDILLIGEYSFNSIIALNIGGNFATKIWEKTNGSKNSPTETYNGKDIGLVAGLKFYIGQLFIRTSYQHGVNPLDSVIVTDENGIKRGQTNAYNQTFQVAVGYYFFNLIKNEQLLL